MTTLRRTDLFVVAAFAALCTATLSVYRRLPDPIAIHFDLQGKADGFGSRAVGAWLLPAIAFGTWLFLRVVIRFMGKQHRSGVDAMAVLAAMVTALLLGLQVLTLRAALGGSNDLGAGFEVLVALFLLGFGFYAPKIKRNAFVGVRLPWTLASDEVWARTHRVASYSSIAGGLVLLALAFTASHGVALAVLLASFAVPVVASVVFARDAGAL